MLVKVGRPGPVTPPPVDPGPSLPHCIGASNTVKIMTSYRGSDWMPSINYAVRIGPYIWNDTHEEYLGHGDYETGGISRIGPYRVIFEYLKKDATEAGYDNNTVMTMSIEDTAGGEYLEVELIPDPNSDIDNNTLISVRGGGQITYTSHVFHYPPEPEWPEDPGSFELTGAKFCLKPNVRGELNCEGANNKLGYSTYPTGTYDNGEPLEAMPRFRVKVDSVDYGVVDFSVTPERLFGSVQVENVVETADGFDVRYLRLIGGEIGVAHRFELEVVQDGISSPDMAGWEFDVSLSNSTVDMVQSAEGFLQSMRFCLAAIGRCFNAPPDILLGVETLDGYPRGAVIYNVEVDDVDYGLVEFYTPGGGFWSGTQEFGEWIVECSYRYGGYRLTVLNGHRDRPVHFKLMKSPGTTVTLWTPIDRPTVVEDRVNETISFCIANPAPVQCAGASDFETVNLIMDTVAVEGQLEYTMQITMDGSPDIAPINIIVPRNSIEGTTERRIEWNRMYDWDNYHEVLIMTTYYVDGEVERVSFEYRTQANSAFVQIKLTPPSGYEGLFEARLSDTGTTSVKVDPITGIASFCVLGFMPS